MAEKQANTTPVVIPETSADQLSDMVASYDPVVVVSQGEEEGIIGQTPDEVVVDPIAALKAEMEARIAEAVGKVQSSKDAEIARYQAEQHRLSLETQRNNVERAKERAYVAKLQQQQTEAAAQQQRQEYEQWKGSLPPEGQSALRLYEEYRSTVDRQQHEDAQQRVQAYATQGIPVQGLYKALQQYGTPEAVDFAAREYLSSQYWRKKLSPERSQEALRLLGAIDNMTAEQEAALVRATVPRPAAPAVAPRPVGVPPPVTPGGTGGAPPSDTWEQFQRAKARGDRGKMAELRERLGKELGDESN